MFISAKRVTDAKYVVLTLVKIEQRTPETRLNPHLIYFSMLVQMHVELTDEYMHAHGSAGRRYEFCTKSGMTLRHDVSKKYQFPGLMVKNMKKIKSKFQNHNFCVVSRAIMLTLAKSGSYQL